MRRCSAKPAGQEGSEEVAPEKFVLKQEGTGVPEANVAGYRVEKDGDLIFISEPEGWLTVNLKQKTFAVGAYEG